MHNAYFNTRSKKWQPKLLLILRPTLFVFLCLTVCYTVVENENGEVEKKMGTGMGSRVTDP